MYVIELIKQPMPSTDFKLKLQKGCEELNIAFEYANLKDFTIDDIVKTLLKNFNGFSDSLNLILRK